jgi:hypothetical protein
LISTDHNALRYVVFSTPHLPCSSHAQIHFPGPHATRWRKTKCNEFGARLTKTPNTYPEVSDSNLFQEIGCIQRFCMFFSPFRKIWSGRWNYFAWFSCLPLHHYHYRLLNYC